MAFSMKGGMPRTNEAASNTALVAPTAKCNAKPYREDLWREFITLSYELRQSLGQSRFSAINRIVNET